jgi:hypothetical protein
MGLAIQVGLLAYFIENDPEGGYWLRESLDLVNDVLVEKGLPTHLEPKNLNILSRTSWGFPYSWIHHLRRLYARAIDDPNWVPTPTPAGENPADDDVLDKEMYMFDSHLICHSDSEGYYLPIDFDEIIVDDKKQDRIVGGLLCSSDRLLKELVAIAPKLGIKLEGEHLTEGEAAKIASESELQQGLWIEKIVWISLFEAARLSIEYKTAICFC